MKLPRTLSAAAALSAIGAALLTTTPAHADGGSPASPSVSASPSVEASPTASASSSAFASPAASASASTPSSAAPAASPTPCRNGPFSMIKLGLKGLPGKIAAGGGWHTFTLNVANTTSTPLGEVQGSVSVDNGQASENADLWKYAYLERWDADSGTWEGLSEEEKNQYRETGLIIGYTNLDARESADLKFRLRLDAKATLGPAYADGGGTYVDPEKQCIDGTTTSVNFDVVAPGEEGGGGSPTASATPTPTASTSQSATPTATPSADASQSAPSGASVNGGLAETGSSSALPLIGAVGGLAVAAGAGAVIMVRRRGNGDAQA
ncbi:LAETG motif-containing sortase-dependent surface protein [Streptomyces bluensis]|uniref:LAETG motif-containing sortase-dependent surface protein n=1 Tax=Streptomyces bluensis TaxID=33897 RepID=UPI001674C504|nr:LAETG motif-containing sortase-dependent surface protein [Streptomyces bluensis]